jgi:hypothetical protein
MLGIKPFVLGLQLSISQMPNLPRLAILFFVIKSGLNINIVVNMEFAELVCRILN